MASGLLGGVIGGIAGGLLAGPAGAVAGFASGMSYAGQQEANAQTAASTAQQIAFQREMATTAHQREVADLRAAGLNPILSATGGSGAAVPGGASYTAQNPGAGVGQAASSAMGAYRASKLLDSEHELLISQRDNQAQQAALASTAMNAKQAETALLQQQRAREEQQTREAKAAADIRESQIPGAHIERDIDRTEYGRLLRYADRTSGVASSAVDLVRGLAPWKSAPRPTPKRRLPNWSR